MHDSAPFDLDLDGAALRRMVLAALERLVPFVDSLPDQAMSHGGDLAGAVDLRRPIPRQPRKIDDLLEEIFERALPLSLNTASGGYLAYVPGGGLLVAAVADLVASVVNRYSGVYWAAPGFVELEADVLRWFAELVGYPRGAGGVLTSGGSSAQQIAITTARCEKLGEEHLDGTLYVSDQTHHSIAKAAKLAGLRPRNVRSVESDARFRIRLDALESAIRKDRDAGLRPFLVVGNAGTTNSGAIDDLHGLARLAKTHGLWFHVDAAWGGFFRLTERGRALLGGLAAADSMILDPHKSLFMPYGSGAVLVRDVETLRRTHSLSGEYMPPMQEDAVDFCELSPELSRSSRGLRIWLAWNLHGVDAFRRALDEKLDLARWAVEAIRETPGLEIVAEPELSLFAFAPAEPREDPEERDRRARLLLDGVNRRQRVHMTGTTLHGRFALRMCILSFRTHRAEVEAAVDDVRAALRDVSEIRGGA